MGQQCILHLATYHTLVLSFQSRVVSRDYKCRLDSHTCCLSCAAVLRRLLREQEQGTLPEPPLPDTSTPQGKAAEMLAVATSHPTWMVKRWLQRWGQQETMNLLAHNNRFTHPTSCASVSLLAVQYLICQLLGNLTRNAGYPC